MHALHSLYVPLLALGFCAGGFSAAAASPDRDDVAWHAPSENAAGSMPLGNNNIGLDYYLADLKATPVDVLQRFFVPHDVSQKLADQLIHDLREATGLESSAVWIGTIGDPLALAIACLDLDDEKRTRVLDLRYRLPQHARREANRALSEQAESLLPADRRAAFGEVMEACLAFEQRREAAWTGFLLQFNPRANLPYGLIPRNMTAVGVVNRSIVTPTHGAGRPGEEQQLWMIEQALKSQGWENRPTHENREAYRRFAEAHTRVRYQLGPELAAAARKLLLQESWFPAELRGAFDTLADEYDAAQEQEKRLRRRRVEQLVKLLGVERIRAAEVPPIPRPPVRPPLVDPAPPKDGP